LLPLAITGLLNRGWAVAPVRAHSISASISGSMIASPTTCIASLVKVARQNPNCNWALATGRSLLVLEVDTEIGLPALRYLADEDSSWCETLRFRSGAIHFFAFHYSGRRVRFLGNRFPGLRLHWNGSAVLVPPSWFVFGSPVSYVCDSDRNVLEAPSWLHDPFETREQSLENPRKG
jgi:hypothetical protein